MDIIRAKKIAANVTPTPDGPDGFSLHIPLDVMHEGVRVTGIKMYIASVPDEIYEDEDGPFYPDGDLGVHWDTGSLKNTGGGNMFPLLMRGNNDEIGKVMSSFYSDNSFDEELVAALTAAGFENCAPYGSEWGMQDEGRASYDASDVAEQVREAMKLVEASK